LQLVDADKRGNRDRAELAINVTVNKPPELKLEFPAKDLDVSPLEEITVRARVWDDFAVKRVGISYSMAGQPAKDVVIGRNLTGKDRAAVSQTIRWSSWRRAGPVASYHIWAEDIGPDGKVRRTLGDMFFAEVRPFEQIFRQGEQPDEEQQQQQRQQQQRQQQQQAAGAAEPGRAAGRGSGRAEKQVIAATWKVIRRETAPEPTKDLVPDAKLIEESQSSAMEQGTSLAVSSRMIAPSHFLRQ